MSHPSSKSPATKPVAIIIAAQMRIAMPKTAQPQRHAPVNVKHALKHAANSSPAARAAFKRAAPAVKAATPHLKALAQPGKGLLSSLRHGVSAMHSLRQVTREMGKQTSAAPPVSSVASAFKSAAASSPAAAVAFKRAGPAAAKAQHHVQALSKLQETPKRSLLSSLGHGIQAMRALRQVTKGMQGTSGFVSIAPEPTEAAPLASGHGGSHAALPGHAPIHTSPAHAIDHRALLGQLRQQVASAHGAHVDGHNGAAPPTGTQASAPFAAMLIVRRNTRALSSFKDRT